MTENECDGSYALPSRIIRIRPGLGSCYWPLASPNRPSRTWMRSFTLLARAAAP
jgi:hypothetical protein